MPDTHVVLGKGPIGRTLATHLASTGAQVVVASRSGAPQGAENASDGIRHVAIDVADSAALTAMATDARTITCCINPPYHRWTTAWPPVIDALIAAGARTGATVVLTSNLYGYGPNHPWMTEDTPAESTEAKGAARTAAWTRLRAAHGRGDIRATEVRGSDYLGPGAGAQSHGGGRMLVPLLAGKTVRPIGSADQPHTWTYLPDFARALATAGTTEAAWGRPWHVPSPEPLTYRELTHRFADAAGVARPKIATMPVGMLRVLGLVAPMLREIAAVSYQFTASFVADSMTSQQVLGFIPTTWNEIVATTLAAERDRPVT